MKRSVLFLLIFISLAGASFGQLALGVRIGYNANKLTTNLDSIKEDFNSGFHVGAWARFGKRFYLAPEIQYSMSGGVFIHTGNLNTDNWKQKITVGSFDIPVLVGVRIIHSDMITWRIEVGPEASFVVNKKISNDGLDIPPITEDDINNTNWYLMAGTGVDVLFMSLDIRYKYQFNKLIEDAQNYTFDTKGNTLMVSLGFKIFGKK